MRVSQPPVCLSLISSYVPLLRAVDTVSDTITDHNERIGFEVSDSGKCSTCSRPCSYVPPIKTVFRHSNKQTKPVSYKHIDEQVHFVRWNMTGQNSFYNNSAARTKAETS